ncbi:hypothetical protein RND81_13G079800 [Saponaria officinalis]|uniref:Uncharacterized protein n=1 Tax=Saponaria officinalis TaxID=3572 RepID=A0AAW1H4Z1_SAPOF
MGEVDEIEEQKMVRFCRRLNRNIANVVDLQPYASFDMLCTLCLKVEAQLKPTRSSTVVAPEPNLLGKWDGQRLEIAGPGTNTGTKPVPPVKGRPEVKGKERDLSKSRCFKSQGCGHFQSECPNRRTVTLREAISLRHELQDEAPEEDGILEFRAQEEEPNETVTYEAHIYIYIYIRLRRTEKSNQKKTSSVNSYFTPSVRSKSDGAV